MKNILYIGNQLTGSGKTATTIDTLGPLLQKEGFHLRYASPLENISKRLFHMIRVTHTSRKWADVVLIDTYSTRNFWYAIIISRICKLFHMKYIPILHGGNLPKRLRENPKIIHSFISDAHEVVSPSGFLSSAFAKAGYHNITTINNCIELENYSFQERSVFKPNILWVRSFAEIYNPQMAIHVLKSLKAKYPNASLTMVGPDKDGSLASCKQLAKELDINVNFTGLLSKQQWIALSKEHDLFINTTHFDNLPVSLLEAMALGLPVISTNVGGITYLIDNDVNGKLVADNDVSQMVSGIDDLIENPAKSIEIINNARVKMKDYSWQEVRTHWSSLLSS